MSNPNEVADLLIMDEGDGIGQPPDSLSPRLQMEGDTSEDVDRLIGEIVDDEETPGEQVGDPENIAAHAIKYKKHLQSPRSQTQEPDVGPTEIDAQEENITWTPDSVPRIQVPDGSIIEPPPEEEETADIAEDIDLLIGTDDEDYSSEDASDLEFFKEGLKERLKHHISDELNPFLTGLKIDAEKINVNQEYDGFLEKDDALELEAIDIGHIEEENDGGDLEELDRDFEQQRQYDMDAYNTLTELRNFERRTKENQVINKVKKVQTLLQKSEKVKEKRRRRQYRELSDDARHFFKRKEDQVKTKMEKKQAYMKMSEAKMEIVKKQWTLEWEKEPHLLDIRMCQIRTVKDKLPEGTYLMLVSIWNRLGGYPLHFQKHNSKVKKSTSEIYHGGQYDDVSMIFDEVIRMSGPSDAAITPRMVFVFELVCLKKGSGSQQLRVNKTVAWGVFPAIDNNLKLIQGCFACPMIRGDIDMAIDKYRQYSNIPRKNFKYWLGNFYFEVKYSGVDPSIRKPEEFVLEVIREGEEREDDEYLAGDSVRLKKKALKRNASLFEKLQARNKEQSEAKRATMRLAELKVNKNRKKDTMRLAELKVNKNRKKDLVLTMAQPRIWFGNPQFSVYQEEDPNEIEAKLIETEVEETEVEFTDEERTERDIDDEGSIFESGEDDGEDHAIDMPDDDQKLEKSSLLSQSSKRSLKRQGTQVKKQSSTGVIPSARGWLHSARQMLRSRQHRPGSRAISRQARSRNRSRQSSRGSQIPRLNSVNSLFGDGKSQQSLDSADVFGKDEELLVFDEDNEDGDLFSIKSGESLISEESDEGVTKPPQIQNIEIQSEDAESNKEEEDDQFARYYEDKKEIKTAKDVQKVYNSLFKDVFELNGATRMDLQFYKQSVKRKKHSWGGTPIYLEKLLYLKKSVLMDLGFSKILSFEFWFMVLFAFVLMMLRCYPHYLGQWIYLSVLRIPIETTSKSNAYHIVFSFRGEFRNTATNLFYTCAGVAFNVACSLVIMFMAAIAQLLFNELPTMIYRFVWIYGFFVILDPFLVGALDSIYRDWEGDMLRLAEYFNETEESRIPGMILTACLIVPFVVAQIVILYQYTLRIHMNRRILDVYQRLHTAEHRFFKPHDAEMSKAEFKDVCARAKKWRGVDGHTRVITVSEIPLDRSEYILAARLNTLLMCKVWPSDFVSEVIDQEKDYYDDSHNILIPKELLGSQSRPAVFLRENHLGKQFSISDFPALADALLFDTFHSRSQLWRMKRVERFLVDFRMLGRGLLPRLREGKLITGQLMIQNLAGANFDLFTQKDFEVVVPIEKKKNKIRVKFEAARLKIKKLWTSFKTKLREWIAKIRSSGADDDLYAFMDEVEEKDEEDDDPTADFSRTCKHIIIQNVSLTREKSFWRHFVQTPSRTILEVFEKRENQESTSSIANNDLPDYWIRKARIRLARREHKWQQQREQQQASQGGSQLGSQIGSSEGSFNSSAAGFN